MNQCSVFFLSVMSVYLFVPRAKTYAFEEFLGNWYQKLKEHDPTTMTVRLQKDIDMYKVSLRSLGVCAHRCLWPVVWGEGAVT